MCLHLSNTHLFVNSPYVVTSETGVQPPLMLTHVHVPALGLGGGMACGGVGLNQRILHHLLPSSLWITVELVATREPPRLSLHCTRRWCTHTQTHHPALRSPPFQLKLQPSPASFLSSRCTKHGIHFQGLLTRGGGVGGLINSSIRSTPQTSQSRRAAPPAFTQSQEPLEEPSAHGVSWDRMLSSQLTP